MPCGRIERRFMKYAGTRVPDGDEPAGSTATTNGRDPSMSEEKSWKHPIAEPRPDGEGSSTTALSRRGYLQRSGASGTGGSASRSGARRLFFFSAARPDRTPEADPYDLGEGPLLHGGGSLGSTAHGGDQSTRPVWADIEDVREKTAHGVHTDLSRMVSHTGRRFTTRAPAID